MRKQRNIIMATFAAAALLVGIGANAGSYAGSDTELKQDTLKTATSPSSNRTWR